MIQECDRDTVVQMIEESEENRKVMVRMLEENEDDRKMIERICEGSDVEVEQALQNYRTAGREVLGWDQGQADLMERGLRWEVEARRKEKREAQEQRRQEEQEQILGQEQHEEARFREKEQLDVMSTEEQNAMSGPEEAKTGRGRAGLVPGGMSRASCMRPKAKARAKGMEEKENMQAKEENLEEKGFSRA